ncbi:MAG: hypothetical protein AB7Q97_23730 [Gammaproteobacteria bacterium]
MRWAAIALLAANVALFAWFFNLRLAEPPPPGALPAHEGPLRLQLVGELKAPLAERVVAEPAGEAVPAEPAGEATVPADAAAAGAATAAAEASGASAQDPTTAAPASDSPTAPEPVATASVAESPAPIPALAFDQAAACQRVGPFDKAGAADAFDRFLARRGLAHRRYSEDGARRQRFWVYLEPASADEAKSQIADLKRKGVQDYLLIKREGVGNAISLGVFSSQDSVNKRLAEMSGKGYKPIVVPRSDAVRLHWVDAGAANAGDLAAAIGAAKLRVPAVAADCAQIAQAAPAQ